jgi:hypothetical protein
MSTSKVIRIFIIQLKWSNKKKLCKLVRKKYVFDIEDEQITKKEKQREEKR